VFETKTLKSGTRFLLDYSRMKHDEEAKVKMVFKNTLMAIIMDIRERQKRPKLSDFLKLYEKAKTQGNAKKQFAEKFKMLYADDEPEKKDPKFERLVSYFDRVQKSITQQHRTLDFLVRKVNKLIESKSKLEHGEIEEEEPDEVKHLEVPPKVVKRKDKKLDDAKKKEMTANKKREAVEDLVNVTGVSIQML
jgi:hypothetical protein